MSGGANQNHTVPRHDRIEIALESHFAFESHSNRVQIAFKSHLNRISHSERNCNKNAISHAKEFHWNPKCKKMQINAIWIQINAIWMQINAIYKCEINVARWGTWAPHQGWHQDRRPHNVRIWWPHVHKLPERPGLANTYYFVSCCSYIQRLCILSSQDIQYFKIKILPKSDLVQIPWIRICSRILCILSHIAIK